MIMVLVTKGKNESVDYARIDVFDTVTEARVFIKETNTGRVKYWTDCEILSPGEEIELMRPE